MDAYDSEVLEEFEDEELSVDDDWYWEEVPTAYNDDTFEDGYWVSIASDSFVGRYVPCRLFTGIPVVDDNYGACCFLLHTNTLLLAVPNFAGL